MTNYLSDDNPVNSIPGQIKKYFNLRIDMLGMHLSKKLYQGMSVFVLSAILSFALLFFLFFASYSFIMWYSDYYGNSSTAAFIVSGFYLLIALVVFAFRKALIYNPLKKSVYNRMDFKEFHRETIIGKIKDDEDFDREIEKLDVEIEQAEQELDYSMDDIKEYYSFDAIKNRFVDDIFENPKPMISTVLQSIMAFRAFKSNKRKK